ncbi:DUF2201 family putative metallopeptidase [Candidatus Ruthia endofausta]|uniref:vWA domain-containing protein n=1 Tax=Candidatus Ruthia endofausta TaxID=2738852 RepID=UPI0030FB4BA9
MIDEHQRLYKLAKDLPNHPEYLLSFGGLLKSHSRLEDRQLFLKIELSDSEKFAIIKSSLYHTPMVKINYQFWQNNIELEPQVKVIGEDVMIENNIDNIDLQAIKAKLTKARTQLILDKPFLGNLVLRLPLKAAGSWCRTSATDAKSFYYNPSFINQLDNHQVKFVLIHEALHCALTHFSRCGNRLKHKWDLACDFAINPLLVKEGFHPPLDLPIFHKYKGMIAEEIYPMIDDSIDTEPMDQHLYDDDPKDDANESDGGCVRVTYKAI